MEEESINLFEKKKNTIGYSTLPIVVSIISIIISITSIVLCFVLQKNFSTSTSSLFTNDVCYYHPLTCNSNSATEKSLQNAKYSDIPEKVLVIAAHPDDIETSAGGTINNWIKRGSIVSYVLITNGDKGTRNHSITPEQLGQIRKEEQINAANVLGVQNVWFLNVGDGLVEDNLELRKNLTYYIRYFRPTIILTWDPNHRLDLYKIGLEHHDHRETGRSVLFTIYPTSNDYWYFPELGLDTYRPKYVLLFRFWNELYMDSQLSTKQQVYVELEEEDIEKKLNSLYEHKSQISEKDKPIEKQFIMNMAQQFGKYVNTKYAEYFTLIEEMI
ncbi:hypothetical protein ABK040_000617 [Willaertia magna]